MFDDVQNLHNMNLPYDSSNPWHKACKHDADRHDDRVKHNHGQARGRVGPVGAAQTLHTQHKGYQRIHCDHLEQQQHSRYGCHYVAFHKVVEDVLKKILFIYLLYM